jgi:hypothetical protein
MKAVVMVLFTGMPEGTCNEKTTLLEAYMRATREYFEAVTEMSQRRGTVTKGLQQQMQTKVDRQRELAMKALDALDTHIAQHNCKNFGS